MTGGDAAEVLQVGDEALDEVALAIEAVAEARFSSSVAPRRDVGHGALILDRIADAVRIIVLPASMMVRGPRWLSSVSATAIRRVYPAVGPSRAGRLRAVDNDMDTGCEPAA